MSDTKTVVISNGSKWAGQSPEGVDELLQALANYALDPTFEEYGNFISRSDDPAEWIGGRIPEQFKGCTRHFFGNFFALSHVFNIYTNDSALIERLSAAIRENQSREDYAQARKSLEEMKRQRQAEEARRIESAKQWRVY